MWWKFNVFIYLINRSEKAFVIASHRRAQGDVVGDLTVGVSGRKLKTRHV